MSFSDTPKKRKRSESNEIESSLHAQSIEPSPKISRDNVDAQFCNLERSRRWSVLLAVLARHESLAAYTTTEQCTGEQEMDAVFRGVRAPRHTPFGDLLQLLARHAFSIDAPLADDEREYANKIANLISLYEAAINTHKQNFSRGVCVISIPEDFARKILALEIKLISAFEECMPDALRKNVDVCETPSSIFPYNNLQNPRVWLVSCCTQHYEKFALFGPSAPDSLGSPERQERTSALYCAPEDISECDLVCNWMAELEISQRAQIAAYIRLYTALPTPPSGVAKLCCVRDLIGQQRVVAGFRVGAWEMKPLFAVSKLHLYASHEIEENELTAATKVWAQFCRRSVFNKVAHTAGFPFDNGDSYTVLETGFGFSRTRRPRLRWLQQSSLISIDSDDHIVSEPACLNKLRQVAQICADYEMSWKSMLEIDSKIFGGTAAGAPFVRMALPSVDNLFVDASGKVWHVPAVGGISQSRLYPFVGARISQILGEKEAFDGDVASVLDECCPEDGRSMLPALRWSLAAIAFFQMFGADLLAVFVENKIKWTKDARNLKAEHFPRTTVFGNFTSPMIINWFMAVLDCERGESLQDLCRHPIFTIGGEGELQCAVDSRTFRNVRHFQLVRFEEILNLARRAFPVEPIRVSVRSNKFDATAESRLETPAYRSLWQQLTQKLGDQAKTRHFQHCSDLSVYYEGVVSQGFGVTRDIFFEAIAELPKHSCWSYDENLDILEYAGNAKNCDECGMLECCFMDKTACATFLLALRWFIWAGTKLPIRIGPRTLNLFIDNGHKSSYQATITPYMAMYPALYCGLLDTRDNKDEIDGVYGNDCRGSSLAAIVDQTTQLQKANLWPMQKAISELSSDPVMVAMRTAFTNVETLSLRLCARSFSKEDAATLPITAEHVFARLNLSPLELGGSNIWASAFGHSVSRNDQITRSFEDRVYSERRTALDRVLGQAEGDSTILSELDRGRDVLFSHISAYIDNNQQVTGETVLIRMTCRTAEDILCTEAAVLFCDWIMSADQQQLETLWQILFSSKTVTALTDQSLRRDAARIGGDERRKIRDAADQIERRNKSLLLPQSWIDGERALPRQMRVASETSNANSIKVYAASGTSPTVKSQSARPRFMSCDSSVILGLNYSGRQEFAELMSESLANAKFYTNE